MAKLVSPGYNQNTLVTSILAPAEERNIEFKGLNRKTHIEEGEMSDMLNLTADKYPSLTPRRLRARLTLPANVRRPLSIISKFGCIAMIAVKTDNSIAFYYDGQEITEVTGLTVSTTMVAINTKICFFPDKTYIEVVKNGDKGVIQQNTFGHLGYTQTVSTTPVNVSNEDARITVQGHQFAYDDALNLVGTLAYTPTGGSGTTVPCNVSCIVEEVIGDTLVLPRETFIELTGEGSSNISFVGTISRNIPDLDHVIEWNNRLWGCSNAENTVHACKLGDPKNWQYFQGTGLDSYYAQQGTDENWTGVGVYSNHIIFFKPSSMCRVYGTAPSNYQIANTQCYGVEDGSRLSVVTINDRVFYKSKIGIMAYDGGTPYCISDKFCRNFRNVVGGTEGTKYYASIQVEGGGYELMVLDIDKAMWHKEDDTRFRSACIQANTLYCVEYSGSELLCANDLYCGSYLYIGSDDESGEIVVVNPENDPDETYEELPWMAIFGPFDEYIENKKIYSKISLRLNTLTSTDLRVYISMDQGPWELVKEYSSPERGGHIIPIIPRRCDRYSIKIEGHGNMEIKALTRRVRRGTYGRL